MGNRGYRILDHPADVGIEAVGSDVGEAFEQAALGLMSVILDLTGVRELESRHIGISGVDYEQLLVKWLSEVLYLYDAQHFVGKTFSITEIDPSTLVGTIGGEHLDLKRHATRLDVKAVTYHQIGVIQGKDGAMVKVFLDI